MAIFNNERTSDSEGSETIIGSSVRVDGNFSGEGNITVDGAVQGTLKTNHDLKVGPEAKLKAEIEANNIFLAGEIRGNLKIKEKTVLKSTAKIIGNLETKLLSVEEGAVINGKCLMLNDQQTIEAKKFNPEKENKKTNK